MIEIRHLHLIQEIATCGSITKAAKKLFLTQPSLSHQLKEIELRLGTQLFLRVNKTMVLTSAGTKVLEAAEEILPKLALTEREIGNLNGHIKDIKICTQCYTCYHWLPGLMKKFNHRNPGVVFDVVIDAMDNPIDYLLRGKIDIAITNHKTLDKGIHFEKLFDDELVLLVPKGHALATRTFVTPTDFEQENLVIYKESFQSDFFASRILIPNGITPNRVTKMQLTEARVELVKAGLGITVLSRWLVRSFLQRNSELKQVRITKKGLYRSWYVISLAQRKEEEYIKQFVMFLKEQELGLAS